MDKVHSGSISLSSSPSFPSACSFGADNLFIFWSSCSMTLCHQFKVYLCSPHPAFWRREATCPGPPARCLSGGLEPRNLASEAQSVLQTLKEEFSYHQTENRENKKYWFLLTSNSSLFIYLYTIHILDCFWRFTDLKTHMEWTYIQYVLTE